MKLSVIGFCICVAAGFLLVFKLLSMLMPDVDINIFTINQLAGTKWIAHIPWPSVHPWAELLAHTNLSLILLGIGLVFIIAGMFYKT